METERLRLRIIDDSDAEFLFRLMNTKKWHQHIGDRNIANENDARAYIDDRMSMVLSEKGFINHVMIDKTTDKLVGTCSLHDREGVEGLDVGYALLSSAEGFGFAKEGAVKMVELAFQKYNQQKVSAITTDQNIGSCKVLERIGFNHQSYVKLPNGNQELRLYTLYRSDFMIDD